MGLFDRKPLLPRQHESAWWRFLDCAEVIEGGVRRLLSTLPVGRVEPAPIGIGVDALEAAIADARAWMPDWRIAELEDDWDDCVKALDGAAGLCDEIREVAATTRELEELQTIIHEAVGELDQFADTERAWRRLWKVPRDRPLPA